MKAFKIKWSDGSTDVIEAEAAIAAVALGFEKTGGELVLLDMEELPYRKDNVVWASDRFAKAS